MSKNTNHQNRLSLSDRPKEENIDRHKHILSQESIDILVKTTGYWCDRCGEPTDDCKRLGCEFD